MTEIELRNQVVAEAKKYLGCKEADGSHKKIIDLYNSHKPLARGYAVKYTDAWCSTYVSAISIACGLTKIFPTECGCEKHIQLFKALDSWVEDDGYVPTPGDVVFYDWDGSGHGDNTGSADHVGIVTACDGKTITVIEGNKNNAVEYRTIKVNGKYIRGYGVPDYESLEDTQKFTDVPKDAWYADEVAYCAEYGLMIGDGNGKFRPDEPITRAEIAAVVSRLHKMLY